MKHKSYALHLVIYWTLATSLASHATTRTITGVAGGYVGDNKPATQASLEQPIGLARDKQGNLYVSDNLHCRIRKIKPSGYISTYAGTGLCGYSGDAGPAIAAMINYPTGMVVDAEGSLIFADQLNSRVRKISTDGTITTIAGTGVAGYSGDGALATNAALNEPYAVTVGPSGNIYIADQNNYVVRMVDSAGLIHTIAGNHSYGAGGDGGPATAAQLGTVMGLTTDRSGNLYLTVNENLANPRVRRVDTRGNIETYAGGGSGLLNTGSGGPATAAVFSEAQGLAIVKGELYISTVANVWVMNQSTHIVTLIAGTSSGAQGFNGDSANALATTFNNLASIVPGASGSLLVADQLNGRVRSISAGQTVTTLAGGYIGDNGQATAASLNLRYGASRMATDSVGNLYIADSSNNRVRKVTPLGEISTFAGTGISGYSGDNGSASSAALNFPEAVAVDSHDNVYICDHDNSVIRRVDSISGKITTFATEFVSGYYPEGAFCVGLAADNNGNLYASDGISSIWKIDNSGSANIVAGIIYLNGYNGDGIPATQALLNLPGGVAVDHAGNLYIADWLNNLVRKVDTHGIISTVAGSRECTFRGDGGPATSAALCYPLDVALDSDHNLYIADSLNGRVRAIDGSGKIHTIAGSGGYYYSGYGLALKTNIFPIALTVGAQGQTYISDSVTSRVLKLAAQQ